MVAQRLSRSAFGLPRSNAQGNNRETSPMQNTDMPKARIYKENDGWRMSVSFYPTIQRLELFTGFATWGEALRAMDTYRMSLLQALANRGALSQRGLVH